jgi:hypothetical protein
MTRQHTNSDLAGNLGASLTPRIDRAGTPPRGAQNSGLFDVGAMYAVALDQVMVRAREQGRLVPLPRAAQPTWPRAGRWPASIPVEVEVPIDFSHAFGVPHAGMGWFGVAVAWLGTVTIAALVSVALPAHTEVEARARAGTIIYVGPVPRAAAPAALPAASPVVAPTPTPFVVPTATPFVLPAATPFVAAPAATVAAAKAPVAATSGGQATLATNRAVVRPVSAPRMHAHAGTAPAAAVAAPAPTIASAPAKVAPVSVPAKPAAASAPAAGTMSLEDLIRHEVQAESKRIP